LWNRNEGSVNIGKKGSMREIMERRFRYKKEKWIKKIVEGEIGVEKKKEERNKGRYTVWESSIEGSKYGKKNGMM